MDKLPELKHESDSGGYYDRKPTLPQTGDGSIVRMPEKKEPCSYPSQTSGNKYPKE